MLRKKKLGNTTCSKNNVEKQCKIKWILTQAIIIIQKSNWFHIAHVLWIYYNKFKDVVLELLLKTHTSAWGNDFTLYMFFGTITRTYTSVCEKMIMLSSYIKKQTWCLFVCHMVFCVLTL
jgi:hypothetical protein